MLCSKVTAGRSVCTVPQGASQTMTTLKNLVHKGVKVDLGLPFELWDEPSVEVSDMKKQVGGCVCVCVPAVSVEAQSHFSVFTFKKMFVHYLFIF